MQSEHLLWLLVKLKFELLHLNPEYTKARARERREWINHL